MKKTIVYCDLCGRNEKEMYSIDPVAQIEICNTCYTKLEKFICGAIALINNV